MLEAIRNHIQTGSMDASLSNALLQMAEHDIQLLGQSPHWTATIPHLGEALGADRQATNAFTTAWCLMYAAMRRLDQLQDGDPIDDRIFAQFPAPIQYHLVISYYVLSTSLLDRLALTSIAERRYQRLQRLWNDSLLRAAGGQLRDLSMHRTPNQSTSRFAHYQELVHAKAGPFFALAFGGVAALVTDDETTITALTHVGDMFGALAQYADDLIDVEHETGQITVLTEALLNLRPDLAGYGTAASLQFFVQIFQAYRAHAAKLLDGVNTSIRNHLMALFDQTFGQYLPVAQP